VDPPRVRTLRPRLKFVDLTEPRFHQNARVLYGPPSHIVRRRHSPSSPQPPPWRWLRSVDGNSEFRFQSISSRRIVCVPGDGRFAICSACDLRLMITCLIQYNNILIFPVCLTVIKNRILRLSSCTCIRVFASRSRRVEFKFVNVSRNVISLSLYYSQTTTTVGIVIISFKLGSHLTLSRSVEFNIISDL